MTDKTTILLVEDDMNLGFVVQDALKQEGYKVILCTNGADGLKEFTKSRFNLCLLDVMLPKKDGFTLAQDIREIQAEIPIVFLTAKAMDEDKVKGFKSGADDYITKPFNMDELLLRIEAILRRVQPTSINENTYQLNNLVFDTSNYKLLKDGESVKKLTKKEAEILKLLCKNKGQVVERALILKMIWGEDNYFNGRSLDVFITKLRKYLKEESVEIINMHGIGFKLEA